jgi:hypothetical protein
MWTRRPADGHAEQEKHPSDNDDHGNHDATLLLPPVAYGGIDLRDQHL